MAAAIWVGGMLFTAFVLTPILKKELAPQVRYPLFKAVGKRFAAVGRAALTILIVTGTYKLIQAWNSEGFWQSHFGRVIAFKLSLVFVMIVLSVLHDFVWGPRLAAFGGGPDGAEYRALARRLAFWSRVNVALVVAIVFLGAYLRINPF